MLDAKNAVEQRIREFRLPATMIAPVYLMENLFNPWNLASQREQQHHSGQVAPRRGMAGAQPGPRASARAPIRLPWHDLGAVARNTLTVTFIRHAACLGRCWCSTGEVRLA